MQFIICTLCCECDKKCNKFVVKYIGNLIVLFTILRDGAVRFFTLKHALREKLSHFP